ncbi:MAG: hypothetical protein ABIA21_04060, partial [Candidatus Aenigmatarchaeota archaeon]
SSSGGSTCIWSCEDWGECQSNSLQYRYCVKDGDCSTPNMTQSQACTYIAPKPPAPIETPSCPECLSPSDWSNCISGKQSRMNYVCSYATDYVCDPYTEIIDCDMPVAPQEFPWWIAAVSGSLAFLIPLILFFLKRRKKKQYLEELYRPISKDLPSLS